MAFKIIPDDVSADDAQDWLAARKVQIEEFTGDDLCLPDGVIMDPETLQKAGRDLPDSARPTWAWATIEVPFELDIEDFIDGDLVEELGEDAEPALTELQDLLEKWSMKWCSEMRMSVADNSLVVMIPASWWGKPS